MAGNEYSITDALYQKITEVKEEEERKVDTLQSDLSTQFSCDERKNISVLESSLNSRRSSWFPKQKIAVNRTYNKYFSNSKNNESSMHYDTPSSSKSTFSNNSHRKRIFSKESCADFSHNEKKPKTRLGYNRLQGICNKDSTEIVTILSNSYFGFKELISSNLQPDILMLTMQTLAKACKSEFQANKASLLSTVCQTSYLEQIEQHMFRMPTDDSMNRKQRMGNFITDLLVFFESVMNILPNTASEKFRKVFISMDTMMKGVENYQNVDLREQTKQFITLQKQLKIIVEEREKKMLKGSMNRELFQQETLPDDFREKSIYPTLEELFAKEPPFVRPNIIKGAYSSIEQYLDVQFRLLREDFMAPLREGISQITETTSSQNANKCVENMRIYENISFGNIETLSDQIGLIVNFNKNNRINIRWENSKRFMFGSLLLFTNDNFKHVIFGSVLERNIKNLEKGIVTVVLHEKNYQENLYTTEFLMLESEVYFEPYKLVMEALQVTNQYNFPMEKYIIFVQKESAPPAYLLGNTDCDYYLGEYNINVLDRNSWPDEFALGLDKSQLEALKAALTEEFVVIQGPPGTGKTFLGLKIAQVLLQNSGIWNARQTPILVVCFTNHALDQFLEGLISVTHQIVRVGGQSKSDKLSKYNLKEKRRAFDFTFKNIHLKRDIHSCMESIQEDVKLIQEQLEELENGIGIISLKHLEQEHVVNDQHLMCFKYYDTNQDNVMRDWLLEGVYDFHMDSGNGDENSIENTYFDHLEDTQHVLHYTVNLRFLANQIYHLRQEMQELSQSQGLQQAHMLQCHVLWEEFQYFSSCLKKKFDKSAQCIRRLNSIHNLWELSTDDRWALYKYWQKMFKDKLQEKVCRFLHDYRKYSKQHEELQHMCDLEILRSSQVVGMTTTCAARLHSLLQILKPKIVIVEEAAEVLESHIIVSLTKECEHLILIGDHQQLRPTTAVYKLACQYNFDISLFERMVKNGMHCHCLASQHRMRPEIVKLIVPTIYSQLENHVAVYKYPSVRGIKKSLFFITHSMPEDEDTEMMSHRNCHEADFLLALCRHLLWQGYNADDITVLSTYKGQMFYMQQKKKSMETLQDVKVTVVDNYQGEENKIILLSLVRSNELSKIGFLRIENRVCVALSRAREGFYIAGNMDNLVQSSKIWPQIRDTLLELDSLGTHLSLQCQVHPEQVTLVSSQKDFTRVPEGGCSLPCEAQLECGHQCESICHVNNRNHKEYRCHKRCERIPQNCPMEHLCLKLCYEDCGVCEVKVDRQLVCGHVKEIPCHINFETYRCGEMVEVQLPVCGHMVKKPCSSDIQTFPCSFPCLDRAQCGHSCTQSCHASKDPDHLEYQCMKPCTRTNAECSMEHLCTKLCYEKCGVCNFEIKKKLLNCEHIHTIKCHEDPAKVQCNRTCEKTLECGHECPKKCYEECGGCQVMVQKTISACGHKVEIQCSAIPLHSICKAPCGKLLSCGHQCTKRCGEDCATKCNARIQCPTEIPCGHSFEFPCCLQENIEENLQQILEYCQAPCGKMLSCGHSCRGSCGECMQGRIHVSCSEQCGRTLICGHKCHIPCAMSCPPCSAKCIYRCKHSRCSRRCGEPCIKCMERCDWKCEHLRCTKLCHELCDREPCYEPCKKFLKCGHECIGFCGEPCPPLCRICNEKEVKEIFFGTEEEDNARFVLLVDCRHSFESEGLQMWFEQCDNEVSLKTCPRCRSYIMRTERFSNYIKVTSRDIAHVKKKIFGNMTTIEYERENLYRALKDFIDLRYTLDSYMKTNSKTYEAMLIMCNKQLIGMRKKRRIYLSKVELISLQGQIEIFKDLLDTVYMSVIKCTSYPTKEIQKNIFFYFDKILCKLLDRKGRMCSQEISDFNRECKRFFSFTKLAVIQSSTNFSSKVQELEIKTLYEKACLTINSTEMYSDTKHEELRKIIDMLHRNVGCSYILNERERKEIVTAMGFKQGHWFKCPNGHIYCIDECGGAMQTGKCPECRETIGGSSHHLLASNKLASEMDGAIQHAYPGGLY